jgi:hypothetical protein
MKAIKKLDKNSQIIVLSAIMVNVASGALLIILNLI